MLAKKLKIGSRPRIEYIFKRGRVLRGKLFTLKFLPNNKPYSRFSLILKKGTASSAVERNKIRRRIYEAIASGLHQTAKTCYDAIVLCSPRVSKLEYSELKDDLNTCLQKLFQ